MQGQHIANPLWVKAPGVSTIGTPPLPPDADFTTCYPEKVTAPAGIGARFLRDEPMRVTAAVAGMPRGCRALAPVAGAFLMIVAASGIRPYSPELTRLIVCGDCGARELASPIEARRLPGLKSTGGGKPVAIVRRLAALPPHAFPRFARSSVVSRVPIADKRLTLRRKLELLVGGHGRLGAG